MFWFLKLQLFFSLCLLCNTSVRVLIHVCSCCLAVRSPPVFGSVNTVKNLRKAYPSERISKLIFSTTGRLPTPAYIRLLIFFRRDFSLGTIFVVCGPLKAWFGEKHAGKSASQGVCQLCYPMTRLMRHVPVRPLELSRSNYWAGFARFCIGFPPGLHRKLSWPSRSRGRTLRRRVTKRLTSCLSTTLSWRRSRRAGKTARRGRAKAKTMGWLLRSLDRHVYRFFYFFFPGGGG